MAMSIPLSIFTQCLFEMLSNTISKFTSTIITIPLTTNLRRAALQAVY
jgi:hypothetical protein